MSNLFCFVLVFFLPFTSRLLPETLAQGGVAVDRDGVASLKFSDFFEISGSQLRPSSRLVSLRGRRVRIQGYMARMEEPLEGAFYLCPRPVYCDESGGGTADLPVETVLVIVNSAKGKRIQYLAHSIEVVGLLEIIEPGREAAPGSRIRLTLDEPVDRRPPVKTTRP
jgi:hypothetical protein